jgi:hypothetical protein
MDSVVLLQRQREYKTANVVERGGLGEVELNRHASSTAHSLLLLCR